MSMYDFFFIQAMEDVDEVYINPLLMRKINKKNRKKTKKKETETVVSNDTIHLPSDRDVRERTVQTIEGHVYLQRHLLKVLVRGDSVVMVALSP